jgi:hypothetical protein
MPNDDIEKQNKYNKELNQIYCNERNENLI